MISTSVLLTASVVAAVWTSMWSARTSWRGLVRVPLIHSASWSTNWGPEHRNPSIVFSISALLCHLLLNME